MKTRILSSLVGLALLAVVLWFLDTLVLNVVIGALGVMAVWELLNATKINRRKDLLVLSILLSLVIPFARAGYMREFLMESVFVLILLFFIVLLRSHKEITVEQVAMAFFFSTFVPVFFSCGVYLRDDFGPVRGGFYLLMALGSAWLCDTGAYFTGIAIGKHKLAPVISPKKTVEGAVGGVVVCTGCMLLLAWGYASLMATLGVAVTVNYLLLLAVTPVFSVIGMLGDLSASVIKRSYGVKDFGHIMPGHGGVLDRFDSVLFTLPSVYIVVHHLSIISL